MSRLIEFDWVSPLLFKYHKKNYIRRLIFVADEDNNTPVFFISDNIQHCSGRLEALTRHGFLVDDAFVRFRTVSTPRQIADICGKETTKYDHIIILAHGQPQFIQLGKHNTEMSEYGLTTDGKTDYVYDAISAVCTNNTVITLLSCSTAGYTTEVYHLSSYYIQSGNI